MDPTATAIAYAAYLDDAVAVTSNGVTVPSVRARVVDYEPQELVSGIVVGDRKAILLAADLVDGGLALPLRKGDRLVWDGLTLILQGKSSPRRVGSETVAVVCQVRGA